MFFELPSAAADSDTAADINAAMHRFEEEYGRAGSDTVLDQAKQVVELTITHLGLEDEHTVHALTNLGVVQLEAGDHEAAAGNFRTAIERVESGRDRLNVSLIRPLRGLGASELAAGRPGPAADAYGRALHVSHVNFGPRNLDQADILYELSEVQLSLDDEKRADLLQHQALRLFQSEYGAGDPRMLPVLHRRAAWLHRLGDHILERELYFDMISLIETTAGKTSLDLIEPLGLIARSYMVRPDIDPDDGMNDGFEPYNRGLRLLARAAEIADASAAGDTRRRADARVAYADYAKLVQQHNTAQQNYRRAWDVLDGSEEDRAYRAQLFAEPVLLQRGRLPEYYREEHVLERGDALQPGELVDGYVTVEYNVNDAGRTRSIEVVDSFPPRLFDMTVVGFARDFRYRPRVVDGVPVDAEGLRFRHDFKLLREHLPPPLRQSAANAAAQ